MITTQVINDVNKTLYKILRESFGEDDKDVQIIFGSPAEETVADTTKAGMFVFLYTVIEDSFNRNEPNQITGGSRLLSTRPALAVNLSYMLTPFSASVEGKDTLDNVRSHNLIAKAMRAFYDNGLIDSRYFPLDTVLGESEVRITPTHMNFEEITKIWTTFSKPFQLSVCYEVSTVWIHSESKQKEFFLVEKPSLEGVPVFNEKEMAELKTKGGRLIKISPDRSGEITNIMPAAVQPGMGISIYGTNFQGKKLDIKIDSEEINVNSIRVINENMVKIKIPSNLSPGVKKISLKIRKIGEEEEEELFGTFRVVSADPNSSRITEIRPNQGKSGDIITIFGINFTNDLNITIGDNNVPKKTFVDNSQINIVIPDPLLPGLTTLTIKRGDKDIDAKQFGIIPS